MGKKRRKKIFFSQKLQKMIRRYTHDHAVLTFAVVFNVFIIGVLIVIHMINMQFSIIDTNRILFRKPDPVLLAQVNEMLEGYPMQQMAPYIAMQNREVAAYLVAIAKKESAWGKHAPKLNGKDCYNYWGFRRKRDRMGSSGHTCFDSPDEAVRIVACRIRRLIKEGYNTPEKMAVWKCGYDCNGRAAYGVHKWIDDVDYYYQQIKNQ